MRVADESHRDLLHGDLLGIYHVLAFGLSCSPFDTSSSFMALPFLLGHCCCYWPGSRMASDAKTPKRTPGRKNRPDKSSSQRCCGSNHHFQLLNAQNFAQKDGGTISSKMTNVQSQGEKKLANTLPTTITKRVLLMNCLVHLFFDRCSSAYILFSSLAHLIFIFPPIKVLQLNLTNQLLVFLELNCKYPLAFQISHPVPPSPSFFLSFSVTY